MSAFDAALAHVLKWEGGDKITDDPNDPGGLTRWGISLRAHPELGADGIRNLTRAQAAKIYHDSYWSAIGADQLPPPLALMAFDSAVNVGVHLTQRWLATTDSIDELAALRGMHYAGFGAFHHFGHGWMRRLMDTHRAAIALEETGA